jgi:hypothetical protein
MKIKHTNKERFYNWLSDNLKCYDKTMALSCLGDLQDKYFCTGSTVYELHRIYTLSGRPECYYFDVEIIMDGEDVEQITFEL